MPIIKPISELKNYTAITNQVSYGNRIYLTKNGHGMCALIDMKELDELDKQNALYTLMKKLDTAKESIKTEGIVSSDDLKTELGLKE